MLTRLTTSNASEQCDQVEQRSPDRNDSMYIDNEVSLTTPLTKGSGAGGSNGPVAAQEHDEHVTEVDITSTHNSIMSATPDSTIGAGQKIPNVKYTDLTQISGRLLTTEHYLIRSKPSQLYNGLAD